MRVQRDKHQTWAIPYTMHKEYADNKYSAITCITTWLIYYVYQTCVGCSGRNQLSNFEGNPALPFHDRHKTNILKDPPGLNSVNTLVNRKVFNTKYQTFRSTPLKPMISSNNPTATDFRIHRLFHNFKFAIMEVINFQSN